MSVHVIECTIKSVCEAKDAVKLKKVPKFDLEVSFRRNIGGLP